MAIKNSPAIDLSNFGGGRNGLDDADKIKDDEAVEQINVECSKGKAWSAKGDVIEGTQISSTKFIGGVGYLGGNKIAACGGSLYIEGSTGTWTAFKSGLTDGTDYDFLEYYNDLYYGNGVDDVGRVVYCTVTSDITAGDSTINVDNTGKISSNYTKFTETGTIIIDGDSITYTGVTDTSFTGCSGALAHSAGTIATQTSTAGTAPKGSILEEWANKFWVSGILPSASIPSDPYRVYYSVTALASTPENFYDFSNAGSGQEFLAHGEKISAMLKYREYLLISKKDEIELVQGFDDTTTPPAPIRTSFFRKDGAINNRCLLTLENDVVYFTGRRIKRLYVESSTAQIDSMFDDPISDILQTLDENQDNAAMIFNPTTYILSLACASKGSTFNNIRINYNTKYKYWYTSQGQYIRNFMVLDGITYYGHALIGEVRKDNESYTHNGAGYYSVRRSKNYTFGDKNSIKDFLFFHIGGKISDNTQLNLKIYVDEQEVVNTTIDKDNIDVTIGDASIGNDVFGNTIIGGSMETVNLKPFYEIYSLGVTGKNISYQVQTSGNGQIWEIDSIQIVPRLLKHDYRELAN